MMPAPIPSELAPNDIRDIQRHAAILLAQVFIAFGHPHELLGRGFIPRQLHSQINDMVRHLEHFVRRFIFVLALALAIDAPPPRQSLAAKRKPEQARPFTRPQRLVVLAPTPSLIPSEGPVRRSRPAFGSPLDLLRIGPRGVAVPSPSLARRLEALGHALCHAGDRAHSVARAIARRLVDVFRPIPKIRLRRRDVKRGDSTLALTSVADYVEAFERLMSPHFAGYS